MITLRKEPIYSPMIMLLVVLLLVTACSLPVTNTNDDNAIVGAPVVDIIAPLPNATYLNGVVVNIQASISNAGEDIARVEFAIDSTTIASQQTPNAANAAIFSISQTWPSAGIGPHLITVTAFRTDGTNVPTSVTVYVVAQVNSPSDDLGNVPTNVVNDLQNTTQPQSTSTLPPPVVVNTHTPLPTTVSVTNTPSVPMANFNSAVNVRLGPGLTFGILGMFSSGQSTEILGANLDASWLKVNFGNGVGWVFAQLAEVQGDISSLPREIGPPTPVPTAVPPPTATATQQSSGNLVVYDHFVNPPVPACGQDFTVGMKIRNDGNTTISTGLGLIQDIHVGSGTVNDSTGGGLVAVQLAPGTEHYVEATFNVTTFVNEVHRIEFVADVNNEVAESNENDNRHAVEYTLPPCP